MTPVSGVLHVEDDERVGSNGPDLRNDHHVVIRFGLERCDDPVRHRALPGVIRTFRVGDVAFLRQQIALGVCGTSHVMVDVSAWPASSAWRFQGKIRPHDDGQLLATGDLLPDSKLLADLRSDHCQVALPLNGDFALLTDHSDPAP